MVAWALLSGCVPTRGAAALVQSITASEFLSIVEHRVDAGYGIERSRGALVGAVATLRVGGRGELALRAQGGTLRASATGAIDRDVGELGIDARWLASSWLVFEAGAARRVYSTQLARQVWTRAGAGAEALLPLIDNRLTGVVRASLLPVVSVSGTRGPEIGVIASAGIEYHRTKVGVRARYTVERYDFPLREGAQRLEQVSALTLQFDAFLGGTTR